MKFLFYQVRKVNHSRNNTSDVIYFIMGMCLSRTQLTVYNLVHYE